LLVTIEFIRNEKKLLALLAEWVDIVAIKKIMRSHG